MSLFSFDGCESTGVCEFAAACASSAAPDGDEEAGVISAVSGTTAWTSSVGKRLVGPAAFELSAAADAAADFQVSEAVVSLDCADASALANRTSSIAASDAPKR